MSPYNFEESVAVSVAVAVAAGRTAEWGEYVATSDPFAGDFGDGSERTLADHLTIAKRGGPCRECQHTDHATQIVTIDRDHTGFEVYVRNQMPATDAIDETGPDGVAVWWMVRGDSLGVAVARALVAIGRAA